MADAESPVLKPNIEDFGAYFCGARINTLVSALEHLFLCTSVFFRSKGVWIVPLKAGIDYSLDMESLLIQITVTRL